DEARTIGGEARIVEAEFLKPADLEILQQHVGARRKLSHDALAFGGLEIEFDRTLAAIGAVEIGRAQMAAVRRRHKRRPPAAGTIAGTLALHLDHVGAEIGENLPGPRTRQNTGKLEHAQTAQRTRHRITPHQDHWRPAGAPRALLWPAAASLSIARNHGR